MIAARKVLLVGLMMVAAAVAANAAEGDGPLAKLLKDSGLVYTKVNDASWKLPYKMVDIKVLYYDDDQEYALIYTTVVDRPDGFKFNEKVLRECMKLNQDYPVVKFTMDQEYGDLDLELHTYVPGLTADELKHYCGLLASIAADSKENLEKLADEQE